MELMSSLLFCAFAAMLPQALGLSEHYKNSLENVFLLSKPTYKFHSKVFRNSNRTPMLKNSVMAFTIRDCTKCLYCMSQAIKESSLKCNNYGMAYNTDFKSNKKTVNSQTKYFETREGKENSVGAIVNKTDIIASNNNLSGKLIEVNGLIKDIEKTDQLLSNQTTNRPTNGIKIENTKYFVERLKRRSLTTTPRAKLANKEKQKKTLSYVTEYDSNGRIFALKVKGPNDVTKGEVKCNIYKVVNTFECGSDGGSLLLSASRKNRKAINNKVTKHKGHELQMDPFTLSANSLSKKEIRKQSNINSALEDSFLPSVEHDY